MDFYLSPASLECAESAEKGALIFEKSLRPRFFKIPILAGHLAGASSIREATRFFLIAGASAAIRNSIISAISEAL